MLGDHCNNGNHGNVLPGASIKSLVCLYPHIASHYVREREQVFLLVYKQQTPPARWYELYL